MKTKRIITLLLAVVMILTFMAINVSAAETRAYCSECGGNDAVTSYTRETDRYNEYVHGCSKLTSAHTHVHIEYTVYLVCRSCGKTTEGYTYWTSSCV